MMHQGFTLPTLCSLRFDLRVGINFLKALLSSSIMFYMPVFW